MPEVETNLIDSTRAILKRITIKDIARELNLHHSTVSRALRNDSSVKEETRQKVNDFAREKGYQVNMSALQIRGSIKTTLAVIVPNINHAFFSNIISFISNQAFARGYVVSVFQSNERVAQEQEIIKAVIRNNMAGVIASLSMETDQVDHFRQLQQFNIPLVLFDRVSNEIDVPKVVIHNARAVESTVDVLVRKGCRKIAYLAGKSSVLNYHERQTGYLAGVQKNGLTYSNILELSDGFTIPNGIKQSRKLLGEKEIPDAVLCDSHLLMQGFVAGVHAAGSKSAPITVASFGGYHGFSSVYPGVVFIEQPERKIADASLDQLLYCINHSFPKHPEVQRFDVSIIEN